MTELTKEDFINWYFDDLGAQNFFTQFKEIITKYGEFSLKTEDLVKHTNDFNLYKGGKIRLV